jgi:exopolysaccharide biosynthesis polyprenyl glycosylphosphotransferase
MLYHNVRVGAHAAGVIDALVCMGATWLTLTAGASRHWWPQPPAGALQCLAIAFVVAFLLLAERFDLYHPWRTEPIRPELAGLVEAAAYAMGAASLVTGALGWPLDGLAILAALGAGTLTLVAWRLCTRMVLRRSRRLGDDYRVWLLVGRNARSAALAQDILGHPHYGIRIAEVIDLPTPATDPATMATMTPEQTALLDSLPSRRIDSADALREVIVGGVVDEVVITLPMRSGYDLIHRLLAMCEFAGISVKLPHDLFNVPDYRRAVSHVGDVPLLTHFRGTSNYPQLLAKRLLDIAVAAPALLLLLPLFALLAVAVRLDSPGPVFFRQTRVGLHGRQFSMVKFRSMRVGAQVPQQAPGLVNERDGLAFKMRNDPRITRVGRWIRRFHVDELPQLLNVLVGDMSLVGPRPLPVHEAVGHEWWQRRRLTVPPGLTCFWQLKDDPSIPFQQWMRMDMDYIDRWSFWLDLKILLQTFGTLARGRGW